MGHGVMTQGLGILWPLVKLHAWATRPQRERERQQRIERLAREAFEAHCAINGFGIDWRGMAKRDEAMGRLGAALNEELW